MDYKELVFTINPVIPGNDLLITALADIGFESFEETNEGLKAYIQSADFNEDLLKQLDILNDKDYDVSYTSKHIEDQNWNETWEKNFQPIIINECIVRAPFHILEKKYLYDVLIEPKMAFGTGHHETTALMIESMLKLNFHDKKVLDMGCGTSVLAILASKMGASEILAIDVEEWSVKNSLENIDLNEVKNINVAKGDAGILGKTSFNVILANINRNVLLNDIPVYAEVLEKEGDLLLSGFFVNDINQIRSVAENCALHLIKDNSRNGWAQLHFVKRG